VANGGSRGEGTHFTRPETDRWRSGSARAACRVLFIFAAPATRVRTLGEPTCGGATSARKVVTDSRRQDQQDPVKALLMAVGDRLHPSGKARRRAGGSSPRGCILDFRLARRKGPAIQRRDRTERS